MAHASHDALLGFVHVFDVHVDEEGHQGRKHEEDLGLGVGGGPLELQVVEGGQDLIHAG